MSSTNRTVTVALRGPLLGCDAAPIEAAPLSCQIGKVRKKTANMDTDEQDSKTPPSFDVSGPCADVIFGMTVNSGMYLLTNYTSHV